MKKALIVIVILVLALAGAAFAYQNQSKTTPLIDGLEGAQIVNRKLGFIQAGGMTQQVTQWYVKGVELKELNDHINMKQKNTIETIYCSPTVDDQIVIVVSGPSNSLDFAYAWITHMGKVPQPQTIQSATYTKGLEAGPQGEGDGRGGGSGRGGGRGGGGGQGGQGGQGGGGEAPDQRGKNKTGPDGP
jgi:uncharacterized membrane protein YgcG